MPSWLGRMQGNWQLYTLVLSQLMHVHKPRPVLPAQHAIYAPHAPLYSLICPICTTSPTLHHYYITVHQSHVLPAEYSTRVPDINQLQQPFIHHWSNSTIIPASQVPHASLPLPVPAAPPSPCCPPVPHAHALLDYSYMTVVVHVHVSHINQQHQ